MYRCRAVASGVVGGGGRGGWDRSSLWMDLFSLDSILVIVTCNCLPFSYSRWFFSETYLVTSAENNVLDPPNLKFFFFWGGGGTARRPYKARAFGTCDNAPPPHYKRPTYGPEVKYGRQQVQPCVGNRMYCSFWISRILNLSIRGLFLKNSCS